MSSLQGTKFLKTQSAEHLLIFMGPLRGRREEGNIVNPSRNAKKKKDIFLMLLQ